LAVDAYAEWDTNIVCHPNMTDTCGLRTYYGPSFVPCDGNSSEVKWGFETCYQGGWTIEFEIVNGLEPEEHDAEAEFVTGEKISVFWEDMDGHDTYGPDFNCTVTVNGNVCKSCSVCSLEDTVFNANPSHGGNFSADCTNLISGRAVKCEPIMPLFYPLEVRQLESEVNKRAMI
jgi:hypothetical protein